MVISQSSCYYDVEEILYPTTTCDTIDMSYAQDIVPILDGQCYVCHGNGANQGGIEIGDYQALKVWIDNGRFRGAVRHDAGFSPMPKNAAKLPDCQVAKIEAWLNSGSPNN